MTRVNAFAILLGLLVCSGTGQVGADGGSAPPTQQGADRDVPEQEIILGRCEVPVTSDEDADDAAMRRNERIRRALSQPSAPLMQDKRLIHAGSGLFVADDGTVLTNYRLVGGCPLVSISPTFGGMGPGTIVGFDEAADVALVRAAGVVPPRIASFTDSESALKREPAYVIGYPNPGHVTTQPTLTRVDVLGSQQTVFSVSTIILRGDVRVGNNGGALLDSSGGVVGVVIGDATQTFVTNGSNLNAVGLVVPSEALHQFLSQHGIEPRVGLKVPPKAANRLFIDARPFMAQVGCWE